MADMKLFEKIVIGIVVVGVILFVGLKILDQVITSEKQRVRDLSTTTATATCNTTSGAYSGCTNTAITSSNTILGALDDIPTWITILIVVMIGGFFIVYLRTGMSSDNI
jgi:hypothetical protein